MLLKFLFGHRQSNSSSVWIPPIQTDSTPIKSCVSWSTLVEQWYESPNKWMFSQQNDDRVRMKSIQSMHFEWEMYMKVYVIIFEKNSMQLHFSLRDRIHFFWTKTRHVMCIHYALCTHVYYIAFHFLKSCI